MRGGHHVIRRRDAHAEFGVDEVEKVGHVGRLGSTNALTAVRVPAEQQDVPDDSPDLDFLDAVFPEYVQYPSLLACVLNGLGLQGPSCPAEVLFADENVTLGVHEGNAIGFHVVVFFGTVGKTADFDFAVAERVDDDLGLGGGLRRKRAVPVGLFCHGALPN